MPVINEIIIFVWLVFVTVYCHCFLEGLVFCCYFCFLLENMFYYYFCYCIIVVIIINNFLLFSLNNLNFKFFIFLYSTNQYTILMPSKTYIFIMIYISVKILCLEHFLEGPQNNIVKINIIEKDGVPQRMFE